ncbi:MAG: thiamine phosphate synthase [Pirellula sp.]|nr:thiamine phosphate synthase [Pirellula sp.]
MEAEICARYGIDHSPIPIDFDEPAIPPADAPSTTPTVPTAGQIGLLRVLDAAANRAGEAVRVAEDHARFVLNDAALMRECKEIRHSLAAALAVLPSDERLAARDTAGDVGTDISTPSEGRRIDVDDVASANLRRLQESLRSLEEYGKVLDPALGRACEQLRYRAYTLQKQFAERGGRLGAGVAQTSPLNDRRRRLAAAQLYVLIDGRSSPEAFATLVEQLVAQDVDILQLRDKTLDDRTLLARARHLRTATVGTKTLFIMNDRPDLAVLADADGVHVGQEELSVAEARAIVGRERLIGVSTHSIEQARQAVADGADYLGVGPTFPSGTKQFAQFPGLAFVAAVADEIELPAFAIGGIDPANITEVRRAGLHRVAVGGSVLNDVDPRAAVDRLRAALA